MSLFIRLTLKIYKEKNIEKLFVKKRQRNILKDSKDVKDLLAITSYLYERTSIIY